MLLRILFGVLSLAALAAPARAADPDALWKIVHGRCVPDEQAHSDPAPCAIVDMAPIRVTASASISTRLGLVFMPILLLPKVTVPAYETVPDLARRAITSGLSLCRFETDMIRKRIKHQ